MFRRARISLLAGLIAATCGFTGLLEASFAQVLFYLLMAFGVLSLLFALFEEEKRPAPRSSRSALQPQRLQHSEPLRNL